MGSTQGLRTLREHLEAHKTVVNGKDGRLYRLRPIHPSDAPSLMRGYDTMSDSSKWFRLLHSLPHLTAPMARAFCSPDPDRELCIVVEGVGELEGEILGGARIAGEVDGNSAEFSVSLRPEAQGLGLARKALETVLHAAKESGYRKVWGLISSRNDAMLALARRIGFSLRRYPDDLSLMLAEVAL
jgi:RimJ/RimL family protein N-acetyltransferase